MPKARVQWAIAGIFFLFLLALNNFFIFTKLRWDGANYLYHATVLGGFYEPQDRQFNFLLQLLPKLVQEITGSVSWSLTVYLQIVANWHLFVIAAIGVWRKDLNFIFWGLVLVAGCSPLMFFYPISETLAAAFISFVLLAVLKNMEVERNRVIAIFVTTLLLISVHPTGVISLAAILGLYFLVRYVDHPSLRKIAASRDFWAALVCLPIFVIVSRVTSTNYEKQRMGLEFPSEARATMILDGFTYHTGHIYLLVFILALLSWRRRELLIFGAAILGVVGFFVLAVSSSVYVFEAIFWQHQLFPIWLFLTSAGFLLSRTHDTKAASSQNRFVLPAICGLMLAFNVAAIFDLGERQIKRINVIENILESDICDGCAKIMIAKDQPEFMIIGSNDLPLETLIISQIKTGKSRMLASEGMNKRLVQFEQFPPTPDLYGDFYDQEWFLLESDPAIAR